MKTLVVCGATASGKTGFAVDMAERLGGEVVSADCMLVYKGLNIGTAKPTPEEMRGIAHHMIDVAEPSQNYSVSDYEKGAEAMFSSLNARNIPAVVCGGTGFYIQSILFSRGLGGVPADEDIRREYEQIAEERGREYLHAMLREVDEESAEKLHPNDVKRVVRALEIYRLTGVKKSAQNDGFVPKRDYLAVAFDYPRAELYARIERRVEVMLRQGLVDEVAGLYRSGIDETFQSMQGIGYKEVLSYLKNSISYSTMSDMIKQNTRNYAKRQITFFKKLPNLKWLDPNGDNGKKIAELLYDR
ncbi:MAG TPA: tRNA (adenosine(37)-N6)-dimethylallyltransferase MiaA [Candidatus Borkfalkia avistercoris]|uniref:tRNA dimethylallyltransferase n=1 Tax=Candidatus Borkfalkia avistercoris TaxID=2838504 RepID=A0A9D2D070_9FIRM|nr:tRNA (adenosine(37)-N6)-dimethylallyltransferase MiaA [Candidatus Borkfalkia avistercoris]